MKKNSLHLIIFATVATAFMACGGGKGDKGVALIQDKYETHARVTPRAGFYNHRDAVSGSAQTYI